MAYDLTHQWKASSRQIHELPEGFAVDKRNWRWNWLERWMTVRPWEKSWMDRPQLVLLLCDWIQSILISSTKENATPQNDGCFLALY